MNCCQANVVKLLATRFANTDILKRSFHHAPDAFRWQGVTLQTDRVRSPLVSSLERTESL